MRSNKIILAVHVLDNADVLREYLEWYRHLGVDLVVANDFGSTDGGQDILEDFAKQGFVRWSYQASKKAKDSNPSDRLAEFAREKYGAEWVILCDTDEFLTVAEGDLRGVLERAQQDEVSVVNVKCLNMMGTPLAPGQSALEHLTLRIDRTVVESAHSQLTGELPIPYIFLRHPPKTIVRAHSFVSYAAGGHSAETAAGRSIEYPQLKFLHYPIRGYDSLVTKVAHTVTWFAENPHLEAYPWWGWHWRRWIRLEQAGRLREDYDDQFVSPMRAEQLVRQGTCSIDETVASWVRQRRLEHRSGFRKILARLLGQTGAR
jgi:hypothetical protein